MPWKTLFVGLLAANLTLSASAPLIIVGTATAAGGLTASKLNSDEPDRGDAVLGNTSEAIMVSPPPVETVERQTLE